MPPIHTTAGRNRRLGLMAIFGAAGFAIATASFFAGPLMATPGYAQQTDAAADPKKPKKAKATDVAADPSPTPAAAAAAPAGAAGSGEFQLVTQLQAAGVKTCLDIANNMGRFEMTGATEYATSSTWNKNAPDKRLFSSLIGQKFGQNTTTPLGLSGVISAPSAEGKCDAVAIQVLPSSTACPVIQTQVLAKGELLGNLAGVPILRNAQNLRVMLLPTAGNGCVIVGMTNYYTE